jgi:hypothetical protein
MYHIETVIGVFPDHQSAETAVKSLADAGFQMKDLSLVGKGYHSDEKVIGFYNSGDRRVTPVTMLALDRKSLVTDICWGLFFGGMFLTIPIVGHVIVLGYLAVAAVSALEGAVVVGGLSALGAALYGIGIPKDSVIQYETDMAADRFLVMAHGTDEEVQRAKKVLDAESPTRVDVVGGKVLETA